VKAIITESGLVNRSTASCQHNWSNRK